MIYSWFGSIKSAINLMKINGLYSILLVKTAHKLYPRALLAERELARGEWASATATIEDVNLIATKCVDLQVKQFISTCSCTLSGQPYKTKHHVRDVSRPKDAEEFLMYCAGIDIHNHMRTGSLSYEDIWHTRNAIHRQFAGITGFLFTNAYLAKNYFQRKNIKMLTSRWHYQIKW